MHIDYRAENAVEVDGSFTFETTGSSESDHSLSKEPSGEKTPASTKWKKLIDTRRNSPRPQEAAEAVEGIPFSVRS